MMTRGGVEQDPNPAVKVPWPELEGDLEPVPRAEMLRFYGKETFALPYRLLETIHLDEDRIGLVFAHCTVEIRGSELHTLFVLLSEQKLASIACCRDPFRKSGGVLIRSLVRKKRERKAPAAGTDPAGDQPAPEGGEEPGGLPSPPP